MREIKFRAFWHWEKKMIPWEDFLKHQDDFFHALNGSLANVSPVMQYTGVRDDTDEDNEIYEGDIVAYEMDGKTINGKVKYEGGAFLLASDEFPDSYMLFTEIHEFDRSYCWLRNTKVIGNVHQNPELLKGE